MCIRDRSVSRREVVALREVTQLVGWTAVPPDTRPLDCICSACLPSGTRNLMRKVRAAFEQGLSVLRRTDDPYEVARALGALGGPLERARGRIPPDKILPYARSPHGEVRVAAAWVLSHFRRAPVEPVLHRLLGDEDEQVSAAAASALLAVAGARRALLAVLHAGPSARRRFADEVAFHADRSLAVWALERLSGDGEGPEDAIRDAAELLLRDEEDVLAERLRALMGRPA